MAAAAIDFANGDLFVASERDEKTRILAAVIFPLLLDKCDINSNLNNSENDTDDSSNSSGSQENVYDSAQTITEAVIFCYVFMRNPHLKVSKLYFSRHPISRKTVFRFLKNYCSIIFKQSPSIHFAVLHSLAFVYHAVDFCNDRENTELQNFIPLWWEYIFNKTFKEEFYNEGHWVSFIMYVKEDIYTDITQREFRRQWNLTSTTLGCDYSLLELSDIDDFPSADESSTSSEDSEETFCNPNKINDMHREFDDPVTINKNQEDINNSLVVMEYIDPLRNSHPLNRTPEQFYNPYGVMKPSETCNPYAMSGTQQILRNPYAIKGEQNECSNSIAMLNSHLINENPKVFSGYTMGGIYGSFCNPHVMNTTREALRNHAVNESQQALCIPTSVIKSGKDFHIQSTMIGQQQELHSPNAVSMTKPMIYSPIAMNLTQQAYHNPNNVNVTQEAYHSPNNVNVTQEAYHSPNNVNVTKPSFYCPNTVNVMQHTFHRPIAANVGKPAFYCSNPSLNVAQETFHSPNEVNVTQQTFYSPSAVNLTRQAYLSPNTMNETQQTFHDPITVNEMPQIFSYPVSVIKTKEDLCLQNASESQKSFHNPRQRQTSQNRKVE